MNLKEAFTFMCITPPINLVQLDTVYRTLIKQYHPDRNQHRLEWSHQMTLRLNEAYNQIHDSLSAEPNSTTPLRITNELKQAWQSIENGIHLYYTFGLENPHLRQEGPFRFKYILSVKQINQGKKVLESLKVQSLAPEDRNHLTLLITFAEAFLQSMRIHKTFTADGSIHHKAYKHYYNGSRLLDAFMKKILFPVDFHRVQFPPKCASLCEKEFLCILLHFQQSSWVAEATIKLSLLESFINLQRFRSTDSSEHLHATN